MSNGRLRVTLVGKLYMDPDVQQSRNGIVVNLTIPTTEKWTDKKSGIEHRRTEWSRVAVFNRNAEIAAAYLSKGSVVYIEGTIRTDKFMDPVNGSVRYSSKLICQILELADAPDNHVHRSVVSAERASLSSDRTTCSEVIVDYSYSYEQGADVQAFPVSYDFQCSSQR